MTYLSHFAHRDTPGDIDGLLHLAIRILGGLGGLAGRVALFVRDRLVGERFLLPGARVKRPVCRGVGGATSVPLGTGSGGGATGRRLRSGSSAPVDAPISGQGGGAARTCSRGLEK